MAACILCHAEGDCRHKRTDRAVLAHRADPNPVTRMGVFTAMRASQDEFMLEQTLDYQARTHAGLSSTKA